MCCGELLTIWYARRHPILILVWRASVSRNRSRSSSGRKSLISPITRTSGYRTRVRQAVPSRRSLALHSSRRPAPSVRYSSPRRLCFEDGFTNTKTQRHKGTEARATHRFRVRAPLDLCVSVSLCFLTYLAVILTAQTPSYDLILRNGRIVDGASPQVTMGSVKASLMRRHRSGDS